jgi:hypothetical protein
MRARGAKIAAADAWVAQKAEIAGVAVFAIAVSNKTTVGKYAAYFVTIGSPRNSVAFISAELGR